jgi:hypothetical protein
MDYFSDNDIPEQEEGLGQKEQGQEEQETEMMANEIVESAPPPEEEILPETVEISNKQILNHLKPQESKYWRFSFKNDTNTNRLKGVIESIPKYNLTVKFETKQDTPDITIKDGQNEVGKINLLLCDRRDANMPEKYYCKLYFYHFKNNDLYQAVKSAVVNLFENFKGVSSLREQGGARHKSTKKHHRTHKKRRNIRRKKTLRRK